MEGIETPFNLIVNNKVIVPSADEQQEENPSRECQTQIAEEMNNDEAAHGKT